MSALVDVVREELRAREQRRDELVAELAGVDRDLEQLGRINELATALNGNGAVETPAPDSASRGRAAAPGGQGEPFPGRNGGKAPARSGPAGSAPSGRPKRAPSGSAAPGVTRTAVLAYVKAHGKVSTGDIMAALDLSRTMAKKHVRALVDNGQLQAEGQTKQRRYFVTEDGDQAAAGRGHAKATGTKIPLAQLKQRARDAIARDPGALTEERLALALDTDREDVAVACGELLDAGDVLLRPDGTYAIDRGGYPSP